MAYTPDYTASDLAPVALDFVGSLLAGMTTQAGTLGTLIIIGAVLAAIGAVFAYITDFAGFRGLINR